MPTKKIKVQYDSYMNVVDVEQTKSKSKPREVIVPEWVAGYMLERDRVIWKTTKDPETIEALKLKYGV